MAEDDLDAFFDEVSEVEAKAVAEESSDVNKKGDEISEPSAKKQKVAPVRPRGVVVAAASVKSAITTTNKKNEETSPFGSAVSAAAVGPLMPYSGAFPPPPPPPPPPGPQYYSSGQAQTSNSATINSTGQQQQQQNTNSNTNNNNKKRPVVRTAAGKVWVDESLADWPDDDFRIFVGNLDPTVTDQQLFQHFANKYASVARSKVVRDTKKVVKNTIQAANPQQQMLLQQQQQPQQQLGVSKGYGFVSLTNALECAKAIREMDQTWLGSRPIRVKRSHWKDRDWKERKKKDQKNTKQRKRMGLL